MVEEGTFPTLNEFDSDTLHFIDNGLGLLDNFNLTESLATFWCLA